MRAWLERVRAATLVGVPVEDVALATILLLVAVASAAAEQPAEGGRVVTMPVAVAMTLPLAWRRRATEAAVVTVLVADATQTVLTTSPGSYWSFVVLLAAAYSAGRHLLDPRSTVVGAVFVLVLWVGEYQEGNGDYLFILLVFGGAWLVGRTLREWTDRASTAELESDRRAQEAAAGERARIARDLHDVVAHGLGVISVQANAAEAALGHDPALARDPVLAIKASATEALEEMRRMLTVLRTGPGGPDHAPLPGLDRLGDLVASMSQAGLPVDLAMDGPGHPLAPGVDLSAYRIVQEALTNVLKHAGSAPTVVTVQHTAEEVVIEVRNAATSAPRQAPPVSGRHGLIGIRERAAVAGGEVRCGPTADGGYVVRVRLPRNEAP